MCKVSIIVPAFNVEKYIRECIVSVINQTYNQWELIVIDDGSKDSTFSICKEYEKTDNRIRVFHQDNKGVSAARNVGISLSKGEWLFFLDGDDYLVNVALQLLLDVAIRYNSDMVIGNTLKKHISGKETIVNPSLKDHCWHYNGEKIIQSGLWGILFKKIIIIDNRVLFKEGLAYSEDALFKYTLLQYVDVISSVEKPVYIYRMNNQSAVANTNLRRKAYHQFMAVNYLDELLKCASDLNFKKTLIYAKRKIKGYGYKNIAQTKNSEVSEQMILDYKTIIGDTLKNNIDLLLWVHWYKIKPVLLNLKKVILQQDNSDK